MVAIEGRATEPGWVVVVVGSTVQEGKMALQRVPILTDGPKFRCKLLSEKPSVGCRSLGAD